MHGMSRGRRRWCGIWIRVGGSNTSTRETQSCGRGQIGADDGNGASGGALYRGLKPHLKRDSLIGRQRKSRGKIRKTEPRAGNGDAADLHGDVAAILQRDAFGAGGLQHERTEIHGIRTELNRGSGLLAGSREGHHGWSAGDAVCDADGGALIARGGRRESQGVIESRAGQDGTWNRWATDDEIFAGKLECGNLDGGFASVADVDRFGERLADDNIAKVHSGGRDGQAALR